MVSSSCSKSKATAGVDEPDTTVVVTAETVPRRLTGIRKYGCASRAPMNMVMYFASIMTVNAYERHDGPSTVNTSSSVRRPVVFRLELKTTEPGKRRSIRFLVRTAPPEIKSTIPRPSTTNGPIHASADGNPVRIPPAPPARAAATLTSSTDPIRAITTPRALTFKTSSLISLPGGSGCVIQRAPAKDLTLQFDESSARGPSESPKRAEEQTHPA